MKADLTIADFTGVYEAEGFLPWLREKGIPYRLVSLSDIEGTNCYCDSDAEAEIRRRMEPLSPVRWVDSGDYHYMTKVLAGFLAEPFTLVLLDNHPDDQEPAFGGVLSCGSWVKEMGPLCEAVWTLGPDRRIRNASGSVNRELEDDIQDLLDDLKGKRVYLSVDKDILRRKESRTDWTQGDYSLEQLKGWLGKLLKMDVVALDLCGELSPTKGASGEDLRINCRTNIDIQEFILEHLKK